MSVIKNPITGRDKLVVTDNGVFDAITGRQIGIIENGVVKSMTTGAAIATISNGSGGSVDLSFITAGAEDILEGKVGADADGNPVHGTLIIPGGAEFYKCAAVDTANKTWSGYKAVLTDGVYSFEGTVTEGLSYSVITPEVGKVYTTDALITAGYIYAGMPEAYLNLPLSTDYNGTLNGETVDFSSGVVGSLSFADGALNFPGGDSYLNLPGVTTDLLQGDFTIFIMVNQTSHDRTVYVAAQDDCFIGIDDYNGKYNMCAGRNWSWSILQADSGGRDDSGNGSVDRVYDQDIALTYVHKGNTWQLYVNDVLSVEKTREGNIGAGNTLKLGAWGGGHGFNFNGKVWGFKIFREALPEALIKQLIESANKPTEPDNGDKVTPYAG
jgi:hypothetical protein